MLEKVFTSAVASRLVIRSKAYEAIYLKKQQNSKYNLCKPQLRGNLKIKNQSISPKRRVGIESNVSHYVLLNFWISNHCQNCLRLFPALFLREGEGCLSKDTATKIGCPLRDGHQFSRANQNLKLSS